MAVEPRYAGCQVALLTQHGKERVIAPVLEPGLGCVIEHVTGFDTDQLGTFTRDTPRPGTQLDAARRKARKGMELSALPLGLASEGSFGPDPFTGMFPWNVELLVWIDDRLGLEVVGMAQGAARSGHVQTGDWAEVEAFAAREGFPQHLLVLRPEGPDDLRIHKGIADRERLKAFFDECQAMARNRQVFVETDLRAFANPSRMQHIEQAAGDLLARLQSACPACDTPGYGVTERQAGLPCADCGLPTTSYRSEVWSCTRCQHRAVKPRTDCTVAEPRHCARCNP
ncbi:MAG: DUF6671 family protein [Burkholderiales bacterium]